MRVLAVLLAYACAAAMAPVLLIAQDLVWEGFSDGFSLGASGAIIGLFAMVAALYALPVALPVIIATEVYRRGDWKIFLLAGVVLGLLMTGLFTPVPFDWADFAFTATLLPIVVICVMTYWAVAWHWLAPRARNEAA